MDVLSRSSVDKFSPLVSAIDAALNRQLPFHVVSNEMTIKPNLLFSLMYCAFLLISTNVGLINKLAEVTDGIYND